MYKKKVERREGRKERKGKERKGKERKEKKRKGKERRGDGGDGWEPPSIGDMYICTYVYVYDLFVPRVEEE